MSLEGAVSGARDNDHGPCEKAILGIVGAVAGGILLYLITEKGYALPSLYF